MTIAKMNLSAHQVAYRELDAYSEIYLEHLLSVRQWDTQ